MSRRRAREAAMQALFQLDMNAPLPSDENAATAALEAAWQNGTEKKSKDGVSKPDESFALALVRGTQEKLPEI
ncbi:MAG: transcription antitermination factor NusB, partial [Negativicutes bacterium]